MIDSIWLMLVVCSIIPMGEVDEEETRIESDIDIDMHCVGSICIQLQ